MNTTIQHEPRCAGLGDRRFQDRLAKRVRARADFPNASVPQALGSGAAAKAADHFGGNFAADST